MSDVHVVWLRGPLTPLAEVSLASYLKHDCRVKVWTYDAGLALPTGAETHNAASLIPEHVGEKWAFGPEKQMALFCDQLMFQASFLYGGWCGHLDVTLRWDLPERSVGAYVFGPHHRHYSFGLWKAPDHSPLIRRVLVRDDPLPPRDWHYTMRIFDESVKYFGLQQHLKRDLITDDASEEPLVALYKADSELPIHWRDKTAIHWCGSGRVRHLTPEPGSYIDRLRKQYETLGLIATAV